MADDKLAFVIDAETEDAAANLDAFGQKAAGMAGVVDGLTAAETRATAATNQAASAAQKSASASAKQAKAITKSAQASTKQGKEIRKATSAARTGIHEVGGAVEELVDSVAEGDAASQKMASGFTSAVSSLVTMGPAAAGVTVALQAVTAGVTAIIDHLEQVRSHQVWEDVRAGTHTWAGGIEELLGEYEKLLTAQDKVEGKLDKWQRRQATLTDDTRNLKDVWLEFAYGADYILYEVGHKTQQVGEYQRDANTATAEYNRMLESVVKTGIKQNDNLQSVTAAIETINKLEFYGMINTERKLELLYETRDVYHDLGGQIAEWDRLLETTRSTEERITQVRSRGKSAADKAYEADQKHMQQLRMNLIWVDNLQERLEMMRWTYNELLQTDAARLQLAVETVTLSKQINDQETSGLLAAVKQRNDIRKKGAEDAAKIREKAAAEEFARYKATAGQIYDIAVSTFQAREDARQQIAEVGLRDTKRGLELERLARLASLAGMIKDEVAAQARKHAILAAAFLVSGLLTEAAKHALAAAALGIGAGVAGTVERGARGAYEEGIRREEERRAEEERIEVGGGLPSRPPGIEPDPGPGRGGGGGGVIREAGVVNIKNEANITIYGPVGLERVAEYILDVMTTARRQGRF